jgi:Tol biopolymer transport system component
MTLLCVLAVAAHAYAAFPGANGKIAINGIATLNPDGSSFTSLADGGSPSWSPDGREIAFSRGFPFGGGPANVYAMDENGLNVRQVTNTRTSSWDPSWSPDGQKLVFVHSYSDPAALNPTTDLYVVRADGADLTKLTDTPTVNEKMPTWSSTGQIAFVAGNDIFVMNADGSDRTRVTNYAPDERGVNSPDWSPDGRKLAYGLSGNRSNPFHVSVHVMNADGTGDTEVTAWKWDLQPGWSPDGRYLVISVGPIGLELVGLGSPRVEGLIPNPPRGAIEFANPAWQPIGGPRRGAYKNAAKFCEADRAFLGDAAFAEKYGTNSNASNAYGKCVSQDN